MASIGWIDFSPDHRKRVGSVLDFLKPEGMVDELGLGTIRDALANQMFPGISTIQTRAKYFFIIPYILYDYQSLKLNQRKGKTPSKFLEEREYDIMWELAAKYQYQEGHGVIGITKRRPDPIARRPSAIYWNGLYNYRFIDTRGLAAESFLKQATNSSIDSLLSAGQQGDDLSADDKDVDHNNMFRIKVSPKLNWSEDLVLDLSKDEAEFFRDRIISVEKHKLIAELLVNDGLWEIFIKAEDFMRFAKEAVGLPIRDKLKDMLTLAHDFSELMYGAHIAYNCQTHHMVFNSNHYDDSWDYWVQTIEKSMINFERFDTQPLFEYAYTTRPKTKEFVLNWWSQTQLGFSNLDERNRLVEQQEANVKGSKSRLRNNKTDDVKEKKWLGLDYFDYRFRQAKTILNDIKTALKD